jgi:hypothetical protein
LYYWFFCCFRLCDEFEKIAEKALSMPLNTAELMEMKVLLKSHITIGIELSQECREIDHSEG